MHGMFTDEDDFTSRERFTELELQKKYPQCDDLNKLFHYVYDYDKTTGKLSNKKVFASGCFPDGIAMDINGNLWVTDCRQGRPLLCYNPQGEVIDEIYFPVYRIISVAFGGEDNSTMFVTTSGGNSPKGNYDGGVFMIENIATGAEEFILKGM